jgi:hypothetical protein
MKLKILTCAFFIIAVITTAAATPLYQAFDKAAYYKVIKDGSIDDIDKEITALDNIPATEKDAFTGTLLMKKAGLVKRPKEKIELFKSGRIKLETALAADNSNTEYHFLRLIIQEHAPKITKYRAQLKEDSDLIKKNYNSLPAALQETIKDYSKTSNTLSPADFNP